MIVIKVASAVMVREILKVKVATSGSLVSKPSRHLAAVATNAGRVGALRHTFVSCFYRTYSCKRGRCSG